MNRPPILLLAATAAILTGCHSTPPPTPLANLNPQQTRGHELFQTRCAACHYDRQTGGLHGPSLLGVFKKPALPSGAAATDERVSATILHGRNNMPALGNVVDQNDVDDLLAYLHTL
jgi:mono/diheme cytochrome c family protein